MRDALLKMQALNEGLGQDKVELSKIIMQLEQSNAAVEVSGSLIYMCRYYTRSLWSLTLVSLSPAD